MIRAELTYAMGFRERVTSSKAKELDNRRAYCSRQFNMFAPVRPTDFHFISTLTDALNVDAKWERAVEGVLVHPLQAIVVPTPDDAVRASQWLRKQRRSS